MDTAAIQPLDSRKRSGVSVTTVVMHATAGSTASGAIATLRKRGLSYHYIIEKGKVYKCCPAANEAYHAGSSFGPGGSGVNRYSVGISFANLNDGKDTYTEEEFQAAKGVILALKEQFPSLKWLTTHYWVSPRRKSDPKGFNIERLAEETGLEIWSNGMPVLKDAKGGVTP